MPVSLKPKPVGYHTRQSLTGSCTEPVACLRGRVERGEEGACPGKYPGLAWGKFLPLAPDSGFPEESQFTRSVDQQRICCSAAQRRGEGVVTRISVQQKHALQQGGPGTPVWRTPEDTVLRRALPSKRRF